MFYVTSFGHERNKCGFHLVPDNWNDFGFYTLYNIFYVDENLNEEEIGFVKIGFNDQEEGDRNNLPRIFHKAPSGYFSVGQNLNYYSKLQNLGDDLRIDCLAGLNDIAYNDDIYKKVINEKVVEISFLRGVTKETISNQFRRIAHGGAILIEYSFNYKADNQKSEFTFEVEPHSLPPTNIHALIGTNGVGKTTTIMGLANNYLENKLDNTFSNAIFISFSIFDNHNTYVSNNNKRGFSYVGAQKYDSKIKTHEELKADFFDSISNILSNKREYDLHKMLEVLNSDYHLKNTSLINILEDFFQTNRDIDQIKKYSQHFQNIFSTLSSGHQIILLSIANIVELVFEKTLIIIDEPEMHLHPPLLSAFIRALAKISVSKNAVAILATHSPVVLQEVPKSCVSIIRKYDEDMIIHRPRFETFGENIGVLTEEVFGLEIPKTGFHSLLREKAEEISNYKEVLEIFNNELSIEAKSILRTYINETKNNRKAD